MNEASIAVTIAAQLPVVVLFAVIVFKMQDRFDKAQEKRDTLFLNALEKVTSKMDDLNLAIREHDGHVEERIRAVRRKV